MADRFPLILDVTDNNKIKEIPEGDNLNLRDVSITNVAGVASLGTVSAATLEVDGTSVTPENYLRANNAVDLYGGKQNKFLRVASNGRDIEYVTLSEAGLFNGEFTDDLFPTADDTVFVGQSNRRFAQAHIVETYTDLVGRIKNTALEGIGGISFDSDTGVFYIIEDGKRRKMVSEARSLVFSILF
jgi:hypothetical protein